MKKVIFLVAVICSVTFVFTACKSEKKEEKKEHISVDSDVEKMAENPYQCPMDCEKGKTYEKEGDCPVCKMKLRKKIKDVHDSNEDH
ncbi:MAG: heavy metal-binding domain-containing protein [Polaribacter sp.]|nr:heavy metal-binding domain-containing protein [Polaribacter sp.]MDG1811323.1 heavy metal-binding domain-containing protein [Polaribacter sp.]MDG1994515.1 heavy metal-binding domain-containing protein [Polaribacter sp.]